MQTLGRILGYILVGGLGAVLAGGGIATVLCLIFFWGIVGIWVWPYMINAWLIFFGKTAQILWWHGFIIGFLLSLVGIRVIAVILALATWIAMMFLK